MYFISFSRRAEIQIKKLDKLIQERILSVLERIKIRPFSYNIKKFHGTSYYRMRVGEYRVILDIKLDELVIIVIEIGHRRNVYNE